MVHVSQSQKISFLFTQRYYYISIFLHKTIGNNNNYISRQEGIQINIFLFLHKNML